MQNIVNVALIIAILGGLLCIICISNQLRMLSKRLDYMLKLFIAQQNMLEILGKGIGTQLDMQKIDIDLSFAIAEGLIHLLELAKQGDNSSR